MVFTETICTLKETHVMSDILEFANREEFRKWLYENCLSSAGIWLLFGKAGGPKTDKSKQDS